MPLITLEPDMSIEPGHQWLVVKDAEAGHALIALLWGRLPLVKRGQDLIFPHDERVDQNLVALINELAQVRFSAPDLVQLMLTESPG